VIFKKKDVGFLSHFINHNYFIPVIKGLREVIFNTFLFKNTG